MASPARGSGCKIGADDGRWGVLRDAPWQVIGQGFAGIQQVVQLNKRYKMGPGVRGGDGRSIRAAPPHQLLITDGRVRPYCCLLCIGAPIFQHQ